MARLRDFQIHASSATTSVNGAFFHTYEPVRLWLKARKLAAPFMKLLVTLDDERTGRPWHGHVTNGLGICRITEAVDMATMVKHAEDHRWLLGVVLHALGCVAKATGWRSPELERFVADLRERPSPLVHVFERLARVDKRTGATCVPWFSTGPRETALGVRIGERDVTVLSGHVWLEDHFPLSKAIIKGRDYVLRDSQGRTLVSVPIDVPSITADRGQRSAAVEQRAAAYVLGEGPLIAHLRAVGCWLKSARELVDPVGSHTRVVPLMAEHLPRPYAPELREIIALAMTDPKAWRSWPTLVRLYRAERDDRVRDILAQTIVIAATDDELDDVIALVRDARLGASRLRLLPFLDQAADPRTRAAQLALRTDPDLGPALQASPTRTSKRATGRATRAAKPRTR